MKKIFKKRLFSRLTFIVLALILCAPGSFMINAAQSYDVDNNVKIFAAAAENDTQNEMQNETLTKNISMNIGQYFVLRTGMFPKLRNAGAITYTSSDPDIAKIDSSGKILALNPGIATITLYSADKNIKDQCTVTIYSLNIVSGLKYTAKTENNISVEWDALEGASGYDIFVNGEFKLSTLATNAFLDNLTPDTIYTIRVRGKNYDEEGPLGSSLTVNTEMGFNQACMPFSSASNRSMDPMSAPIGNPVTYITNKYDLQAINNNLSGNYVLANDIDMADFCFTPIGSQTAPFRGTFNGNGKTISNLEIGGYDHIGLFGVTACASIKNLNIENAVIWGDTNVGMLIGTSYCCGTVKNCSVSGYAWAWHDAGGLIGVSYNTTVVRSHADIYLSGSWNVGGLIGIAYGGFVKDCYVIGYFAGGRHTGAAGFIHDAYGDITIENCYTSSDFNNNYAHAFIFNAQGNVLVLNCYYADNSWPIDFYALPKTPQQLMQQTTFAGWDFTTIWDIVENETYPFLRKTPADIVVNGQINSTSQIDEYPFSPGISGVYTIFTTGSTDTAGRLFDSTESLIYEHDNKDAEYFFFGGGQIYYGPIDYNFRITSYMCAEEAYTIEVLGNTTGEYTLTISYVSDILPMSGSELEYEPYLWNSDWTSWDYNCYNYALNTKAFYFLQPGQISGNWADYTKGPEEMAEDFIYFCTADADIVGGAFIPLGENDAAPDGHYKVALVFDYFQGYCYDYHWYRQNADGTWSHKPGGTFARDTDLSWQTMWNPRPDVSNAYTYDYFVGYFAVKDISDYDSGYSTSTRSVARQLPLKSHFSLDEFDFIMAGMSVSDVKAVIGEPNSHAGSGILKDVYNLDDGRRVVLDYGMYREGLRMAYIIDFDGEFIDLLN